MELSHEWQPYDGNYQKEMQDIILSNGKMVTKCWPNAGFWNVCEKEGNEEYYDKAIPNMEVRMVRLTKDSEF